MDSNFTFSIINSDRARALDYLAAAYAEHGYKAVAQALRTCGPNATKFKVELRAIELAMADMRKQMASATETAAPGIRQVAYN